MKITSINNNYYKTSSNFKASLLQNTGEVNNDVKTNTGITPTIKTENKAEFKQNIKNLYKLIIPIFLASLTFSVRYFKKEIAKNEHRAQIQQSIERAQNESIKRINKLKRQPLRINLNTGAGS